MEQHTNQETGWVSKFLDEGKEIMGMDCSGLVGLVSSIRAQALLPKASCPHFITKERQDGCKICKNI